MHITSAPGSSAKRAKNTPKTANFAGFLQFQKQWTQREQS
jgi:hypothetical protein